MARARNIKPSFFTDSDLGVLSPYARLLFAGLWCLADREGRLYDKPLEIKVQALPYDDVDIDALLNELDGRFITRYVVQDKKLIQINNFEKHQNPHKNENQSVLPPIKKARKPTRSGKRCTVQAPEHSGAKTEAAPEEDGTARADSLNLIPDSVIEHGAETASAVSPSEPAAVISLPLHDNTEYPVTQTLIDKWSALYPAVDVVQELRKMCGWLDSHPNRRKTRRGVPGFITGWLGREQDRGRVTENPKGRASPPKLCALDDLFETFDEEAT